MRNDVTDKITGSVLTAAQFDSLAEEVGNVITVQTGQTFETPGLEVNEQLGIGIAEYVAANNSYTAAAVGSNYLLTQVDANRMQPSQFIEGLLVRFIAPAASVNGQTMSLAAIAGGPYPIYKRDATVVGVGDIENEQIVVARWSTDADGGGTDGWVLDFGTAAFRDIGTADGEVLVAGDAFGLGELTPTAQTANLNTFENTQFISASSSAVNTPSGLSGTLISQAISATTTTQYFINASNRDAYIRSQVGGVWSSWERQLNSTDIGISPGQIVTVGNFSSVADFGSSAFIDASTSATNNTVVQRNSSAQIFSSFFNTTASFTTSSALSAVFVETGSDGFIRKQTEDNFKTSIGVQNLNGSAFTGTLSVAGAITATGDITGLTSDERLKNVIKPIDPAEALDTVIAARKVRYVFNELASELTKGVLNTKDLHIGLMVQDFEKSYPELTPPAAFTESDKYEGDNYKTLKYAKMVTLAFAAIEQLKKERDEDNKLIAELQEKLEDMEQRLDNLEYSTR